MLSKTKIHGVRIENDVLIVNGVIVPYGKQAIRSQKTLFVTDLGIEVPISKELQAYDDRFFHSLLNKQLLAELESCHSSVGLEILQQFSALQVEHYEYLITKLSLRKLGKLLRDDDFLLFLSRDLRRTVRLAPQAEHEAERSVVMNLGEAYQRAIYLLVGIQESCGGLKEKLEITCKLLIYQIAVQPNFIQKLAYPNCSSEKEDESERKPEAHFLLRLQEYAVWLSFLEKITSLQSQIDQYYLSRPPSTANLSLETNILLESTAHSASLKTHLFNKPCLRIIATNFEQFFHYNRKELLKILALIIMHNREQFWSGLIAPKGDKQQKCEEMERKEAQQNIDNSNNLRQLLLNNYFCTDDSWTLSLFVLEHLNSIEEAQGMLIELYQELIQFPLESNVVEVLTAFIARAAKQKALSPHFKLLLSGFLEYINYHVDAAHDRFVKMVKLRKNQYLLKSLKIKTANLSAFIRAFSAIISCDLLDILTNFSYQKSIEKLLQLSKGKDSMISGAMIQLTRTITAKLKASKESHSIQASSDTNRGKFSPKKQSPLQRLGKIIS